MLMAAATGCNNSRNIDRGSCRVWQLDHDSRRTISPGIGQSHTLKSPQASDKLPEQDAKRVHIAGLASPAMKQQLRRHVSERTLQTQRDHQHRQSDEHVLCTGDGFGPLFGGWTGLT